MYSKIKSVLANDMAFYSLVIIGVAVTSFGLGRLSVPSLAAPLATVKGGTMDTTSRTLVPTSTMSAPASALVASTITNPASAQKLVASKSGSKYHFAWCPGAKQIKEANKVYFDSPAAARAAGYTPAANCPGLE